MALCRVGTLVDINHLLGLRAHRRSDQGGAYGVQPALL